MFAKQNANISRSPMQVQHLFFRPGGYHYVIRVPQDLSRFFPVKTIWRSLKTKDPKAAKILVKAREHDAEKLFMQLRSGMLTDDQIKTLVAEFLHGELSAVEAERSTPDTLRRTLTQSDENIDFLSEIYGKLAGAVQKDLARGNLAYGETLASAIIDRKGLAIDPGSEDFRRICREIVKTEISRLTIEAQRTLGDYNSEIERATNAQLPPPQKGLLLSELIEKYSDDRIESKKWAAESTIKDMKASYALLLRVRGDFYIDDVDYEFAKAFRSVLIKIPANSNKGRFQDKSVAEILEMPNITPMSTSNFNKNIGRIAELFQYAFDKDLTKTKNYFKGLEVLDDVKDCDKRRPFTHEEIDKVLTYLIHLLQTKIDTDDKRSAICFDYIWIFLLGIYTGCRSNELCQLTADDILVISEITCIRIKHDPDQNQSTKNRSSRRIIPVPPQILELGFLEFVEKQKTNRNGRLWKSLSLDTFGRWNKNFSRNINGYIDAALGFCDRRICYHSTRHNLGDALDELDIKTKTIKDIKGHTSESIEVRVYQSVKLKKLLDAMVCLDYGLDMQRLKDDLAKLMDCAA